jgi:hypothetical protein
VKKEKYFLDTSVLRPLLAGTKAYKKYVEEQFKNGQQYTSPYVLMEFKRSYIRNILNFYLVLDMPSIESAGDAINFWSNKFRSSELKAVLQLVGNIIDTHRLNVQEPRHKQKIMQVIAQYAKRLEIKSRRLFANIGKNETHCHRAKIPLRYTNKSDTSIVFKEFLGEFNDETTCRKKCRVDMFFMQRHKGMTEAVIAYDEKLLNKNSNIGFSKISSNMKEAKEDGRKFSCRLCEAIGDAVIAIESPPDMRLEHTDHSFDHLCAVMGKPHKKHPSETSIRVPT